MILVGRALGVLVLATAAGAQTAPSRVEVRSPAAGAVLAWGRDAPRLRLEALLQGGDGAMSIDRLYLTAVVGTATGVLVDRVSLFDDGTHGDAIAGDGTFSASYIPPEPQPYTVRVRAQWSEDRGGRSVNRETMSEPISVTVERVPYPVITAPNPGANVSHRCDVSARLLLGEDLFTGDDPGLTVAAWSGDAEPVPAVRRGRDWIARLELPELGQQVIHARAEFQRGGQTISTTADPIKVQVAKPPVVLMLLGALVAAVGLLTGRPAMPRYRHELRFRRREDHAEAGQVTVEMPLSQQRVARKLAGAAGDGGDEVVPALGANSLTLTAEPGRKMVEVRTAGEPLLQVEGGAPAAQAALRPGERFELGDLEAAYEAEMLGVARRPFWHFTASRACWCGLGVALLVAGWSQYRGFYLQ